MARLKYRKAGDTPPVHRFEIRPSPQMNSNHDPIISNKNSPYW